MVRGRQLVVLTPCSVGRGRAPGGSDLKTSEPGIGGEAVAFSCRQRCLCPSCHQKRELIWVDFATEELLEEVPHRQVVFTIPKSLRIYFRYDRKLLGELAGCAWRAIRLYLLAAFDSEDIQAGAVGFIQTAG